MTEPSAKVILDSVSRSGDRLISLEIEMHRFVLAELNTHRAFSRSSASSRAIPVAKQIERVLNDPAMPVEYCYNQAGMQASEPLDESDRQHAEKAIIDLMHAACKTVEFLSNLGPLDPETGKHVGLHKQWANRYLEPWMWHKVIVTSTDWENFFRQRCSKFSPLAQPEFRAVADSMFDAIESSEPSEIAYGDWHTPYILDEERSMDLEKRKRISTARCARVSYLTHDGIRDHAVDMKLFNRLESASPPHAAPLEMVARPMLPGERQIGNFAGWRQFRHELLGF